MQRVIIETVAAWTNGQGDPYPLISIADRESAFVNTAVGDESIAADVFARDRDKLAQLNPWTDDPSLWAGSFGLYQLMAPYEVQRWAVDAHPHVLFNPVIATVVAMRRWNRAINLGAKTPVDVRMVWAYAQSGLDIPHDDPRYTSRVESERKRWKKLGLSGDPATIEAAPFAGAGTGPQTGQNAKFKAIATMLGMSTNPLNYPGSDWTPQTNTDTSEHDDVAADTSSRGWGFGLAAICLGGAAFLLWQTQQNPSKSSLLAPHLARS